MISTRCWRSCEATASRSSRGRSRTRTAALPGSSIPTATSSNCGSRDRLLPTCASWATATPHVARGFALRFQSRSCFHRHSTEDVCVHLETEDRGQAEEEIEVDQGEEDDRGWLEVVGQQSREVEEQ